jgi:putative Ca2+/H+ antiporter (TMEM165/GDT1 family)
MLEAFFVSSGVAALAEIGDKTQLLALMLAAKLRMAIPIVGWTNTDGKGYFLAVF